MFFNCSEELQKSFLRRAQETCVEFPVNRVTAVTGMKPILHAGSPLWETLSR